MLAESDPIGRSIRQVELDMLHQGQRSLRETRKHVGSGFHIGVRRLLQAEITWPSVFSADGARQAIGLVAAEVAAAEIDSTDHVEARGAGRAGKVGRAGGNGKGEGGGKSGKGGKGRSGRLRRKEKRTAARTGAARAGAGRAANQEGHIFTGHCPQARGRRIPFHTFCTIRFVA